MSDCKHEKRTNYRTCYGYVCYCIACEADITSFELEALERAEKAEARIKELDVKLSEAHNLLGLALDTFNASQGNSKYIIREWLEGAGK